MNLVENGLVDTAEEGEDAVNWESGIDIYTLSSVQFSRSVMSDSATPWTAARQASLSITNFQSPYTLPRVRKITSGKLLCSTGSLAQCSVMTCAVGWQEGREVQEGREIYIYNYDWLHCCMAETNTK